MLPITLIRVIELNNSFVYEDRFLGVKILFYYKKRLYVIPYMIYTIILYIILICKGNVILSLFPQFYLIDKNKLSMKSTIYKIM